MSKFTTFLSSNAALVVGAVVATGVAVVALVASGVLGPSKTGPEPVTTVQESVEETAPETQVAVPTENSPEAVDDTAAQTVTEAEVAPEEDAPEAEVADSEPEQDAQEVAEAPEPAADATETVAQTETSSEMEKPAAVLPAFDLVRIEPDGSGQIAGTAAPNGVISVLLDGVEIASAQADTSGKFFAFINLDPSPQPRELMLVERQPEGDLLSDGAFLVAPIAAPVVVAEAETPEAEDTSAAQAEVADVVQETAEAVADSASETQETQPEPKAPAVLVSDSDGVRVVQPAASSSEPEVVSAVSIDAISYSDTGDVVVSGRGLENALVQLYLDNALAQSGAVDAAGTWSLELSDVAPGLYTMRVDELDAAGKVLSRVETPFKREAPEVVAEAQAVTPSPIEPQIEDVATASENMPVAEAPDEADAPEEGGSTETAETVAPSDEVETVTASAPEVAAEAEPAANEPSPQKPTVQIVTVQPGSTLWAIARDRYGEGTLYVQLFEANKDKIRDPDLIYPGQVFTVPE